MVQYRYGQQNQGSYLLAHRIENNTPTLIKLSGTVGHNGRRVFKFQPHDWQVLSPWRQTKCILQPKLSNISYF
jgi:hypothetical protein